MTTISYYLPKDEFVNVNIYNASGKLVRELVSSKQNLGVKSIRWDATNNSGQPVSAGLYLYTIQAGDFRQTKKMVLLK
ncbi:MAG: T9SS type A sorting domain-containing protein [Candidatus Marinimicrobia bacterium]|nr:T9SS type A sorting domain-containing protein [Candidatus Neomarinimicrobiota bacterium]